MSEPLRILVVGGVAGGASAAARARRLSESAHIVVFERGPYVSFANCGLPYHIGGVIENRKNLLVQTPESLSARFNLDVRVNTEVRAIDRKAKQVCVRNLQTGQEYSETYDALVLSPGAEPIRPAIPGIDDSRVHTLRNMGDMDAILVGLRNPGFGRILVVGGGYIGVELADSLRHRGLGVVLVERLSQVMAVADAEMVEPLHQELLRQGVELHLNASVTALDASGENLAAVLQDGSRILCDLAILCVGVRPDTTLAKAAGLELGSTGGIRVDEQMRTSDSSIFAVGDAVEIREFVSGDAALIPLAGPANRQGRIAADAILGRDSRYLATQGSAICKVFELTFAMTGLSERSLSQKGIPFQRIYVFPADHATYYPGATAISLKLLFAPESGRILGAQAVGRSGVDKRIDILAVAIRGGLTVFDLEDLELCYAPPFGSAKDAVNMAGFVASNTMRGDMPLWEPEEVATLRSDQLLLDVRTQTEFNQGTIPGAEWMPVDELRERLDDLPRHKELLLFCQVGLRGYVAARILSQRGFRVRNLSGGYKRYQMWVASVAAPSM